MAKLFYSDKGSGIPVVLIHGFCESHLIWEDLSENLKSSFRILCPDLPGFGKSPLPELQEFTLEDIAQIIADWLGELGIDQCIVIGHSLGGYITLALADGFPDLVSGFGLFHSSCYSDTEEKKLTRDKVVSFLSTHGSNEFTDTFIPGLFYKKSGNIRKDIDRLVQDAKSFTSESLISYTLAMKDRPGRCHLLNRSRPILFIAGEKDLAVPVELSAKQAKALNPNFVHILSETGHMGMFERKIETEKIISHFLEQF